MDTMQLSRPFLRMGARVKIRNLDNRQVLRRLAPGSDIPPMLRLNVLRDEDGEYFDISLDGTHPPDIQVLEVRPQDRHLLLLSREGRNKFRYLLGHDERHWFVAAVPESSPVSTVDGAKQALKPDTAKASEAKAQLRGKDRHRRHNDAWHRQGEWFFSPAPDFSPPVSKLQPILRNEPIARARSKPHICEELYRRGGVTVYVCRAYPNGLTEAQYKALPDRLRTRIRDWQIMKRDMDVFVRGKVRHPDHKTLVLNGWHRVEPNTESRALAMRHVVFLD